MQCDVSAIKRKTYAMWHCSEIGVLIGTPLIAVKRLNETPHPCNNHQSGP